MNTQTELLPTDRFQLAGQKFTKSIFDNDSHYINDMTDSVVKRLKLTLSKLVTGVGSSTITKMIEASNNEILIDLVSTPDIYTNIPRLDEKKLQALSEKLYLSTQTPIKAVSLMMQLGGFYKSDVQKMQKIMSKMKAKKIITFLKNPYNLLKYFPTEASFTRCDIIANILGYDINNPNRLQGLIVVHMISDNNKGYICSDSHDIFFALYNKGEFNKLSAYSTSNLELTPELFLNAMKKLSSNNVIVMEKYKDKNFLYLPSEYKQEVNVANNVLYRIHAEEEPDSFIHLNENHEWIVTQNPKPITDEEIDYYLKEFQNNHNVELAQRQLEAVSMTLKNKFSVLTGMPGTGKTTVLQAIIGAVSHFYPEDDDYPQIGNFKNNFALMAPTGRAAQQMMLSTHVSAKTIHSALHINPASLDKVKKVKSRFLIIDETSMLDMQLTDIILDKTNPDTHILFVGDYQQLPSISSGKILHDLIDSGVVPVTELNHIFRQAEGSRIVENDFEILKGHGIYPNKSYGVQVTDIEPAYTLSNKKSDVSSVSTTQSDEKTILSDFDSDELHDSCIWINADNQDDINKLVLKVVEAKKEDNIKTEDIMVLSPQHTLESGVDYLNASLQKLLNPVPNEEDIDYSSVKKTAKDITWRSFRVGDRVIQTKNNYNLDVINGDLGFVTKIIPPRGTESAEVHVKMDEHKLPVIYTDEKDMTGHCDLEQLQLGYATTVHKAQGSEANIVIMAVDPGHSFMLNRTLLYTAASRAKKQLIFIGDKKTFNRSLYKVQEDERLTLLPQRLKGEL